MNFKEIQEVIKLVNKLNMSEFKLKDGTFELSIRTKDYSKSKMIVTESPQVYSAQTPQLQSIATPVNVQPATQQPAPAAAAAPVESPEASAANTIAIKSPIVGTFYRSQSPDKPVFKKVGDKVEVGDVVCIVEAMKLFNEIESEVSGTIVKVMTEDASPVEYDQVLFLVEPS